MEMADLSSDLTTKYSYSSYSTCPSSLPSQSFIHTLTSSLLGLYPFRPSVSYVFDKTSGTSLAVIVYRLSAYA